MENIEVHKKVQNTYYLHSYKDFERIKEIIKLMPNYDTKSISSFVITDYFYETPENLLNELDASIRVRVVGDTQTLSIICKNDGVKREFEIAMNLGDKIQDKNEYILFLEDKLQDIYTHKIDADIARMLKSLKVFMYVVTNRTQYEVINNSGFDGLVNLDQVMFHSKRHDIGDNILEVKLNCLADVGNMTAYNRFVYTLEQKVLLLPMQETKYDAGKRIFKYEY